VCGSCKIVLKFILIVPIGVSVRQAWCKSHVSIRIGDSKMSNIFKMVFGDKGSSSSETKPAKRQPFGGKRHTLTDADRAKAAATRKAQAAAKKAAKRQAKSERAEELGAAIEPKATGSKAYFASPVHEAFNFRVKSDAIKGKWLLFGDSVECDSRRLVGRLSVDMPLMRPIKHDKVDLCYVLVHRATGNEVCVLIKDEEMTLTVTLT
jgi:hypothetical protein